jgi:branched-subunit amino acid ABC-type transport system permease component
MAEQLILNGFVAGSIYSLVAVGFAVIYQTTRFFPRLCRGRHFAHGAVYTVITHLPAIWDSLGQAGMTQIVRRYSSCYTHRTDHTYCTDYHAG